MHELYHRPKALDGASSEMREKCLYQIAGIKRTNIAQEDVQFPKCDMRLHRFDCSISLMHRGIRSPTRILNATTISAGSSWKCLILAAEDQDQTIR